MDCFLICFSRSRIRFFALFSRISFAGLSLTLCFSIAGPVLPMDSFLNTSSLSLCALINFSNDFLDSQRLSLDQFRYLFTLLPLLPTTLVSTHKKASSEVKSQYNKDGLLSYYLLILLNNNSPYFKIDYNKIFVQKYFFSYPKSAS